MLSSDPHNELKDTGRVGSCPVCKQDDVPLVNRIGGNGSDALDRFKDHCDSRCDLCPQSGKFVNGSLSS